MGDIDAYAPPRADVEPAPPGSGQFAPCPKCKNTKAKRVRFTWWGGALGPKMFSVVQCVQCRTRYNGKTGASLTATIILYNVVLLAIVTVALWLLR